MCSAGTSEEVSERSIAPRNHAVTSEAKAMPKLIESCWAVLAMVLASLAYADTSDAEASEFMAVN